MASSDTGRPLVLVVDADPTTRRLTRLGLEIDGALVVEATSLTRARDLVSSELGPRLHGVVLDPLLPDGDGLALVADLQQHAPGASVIVVSCLEGSAVPPPAVCVEKGDLAATAEALALDRSPPPDAPPVAARLLQAEADEIATDWEELCRWDPMLPPDTSPPLAAGVVAALGRALNRPQPLGWGPDPDVETEVHAFESATPSLPVAIGELVCLRDVLTRHLQGRLPPEEAEETWSRLHMIIDRAIGVVVEQAARHLEEQAFLDTLTGLLNRRALERDLRREIGRAARYGRRSTIVIVDLDGLKQVNDTQGHVAGDATLQAMAEAIRASLRAMDAAYRIGGDEFVVLLIDAGYSEAATVVGRFRAAGAPAFSWGAATFPDEGEDLEALSNVADRRLYQSRRMERGPGQPLREEHGQGWGGCGRPA